ncbi:MAG: hypothetical protein EA423_11540 [Phycisphaerales bacterium]|nr:MAG: hypothetical protein EA423_11540 [Phycisphaerales bacterium]
MNRTITTLAAGLLGTGLFLGACGGEREGEQGEGQRTTAEVTMAALAGEWGFQTEELREAIRRGVEADYRVPGMPAGQTPDLQPEDIEVIDMMTEELATIRLTLQADGSMTIVGESMTGGAESDEGAWELRNRNILIMIDEDDEPIRGRVIDTDTIEIDLEDLADFEVKAMLRRRS